MKKWENCANLGKISGEGKFCPLNFKGLATPMSASMFVEVNR